MNEPGCFRAKTKADNDKILLLEFAGNRKLIYGIDFHHISDFDKCLVSWARYYVDGMIISEKYQDWFCFNYPELISKINNLSEDVKVRYSNIMLMDKFGVINV